MTATVAGIHLGLDTHANRPAANTVPDGSIYSCSTHSLIYKSNFAGNSWATYANLSGTGFADPMTTRGDSIFRNSSNVTDRLPIPAAGQVLGRSGSDLGAIYPPGYEFDYAQVTSNASITATTEATANTVVTANAVTYDGATPIILEAYCPNGLPDTGAAARNLLLWLYDGAASIGLMGATTTPAANNDGKPLLCRRRLTPSAAAHTYSIRASVSSGTGTLQAGAGGAGVYPPIYIRQTKV